MEFTDHYEFDAASIKRRTRNGYLVAAPRVARTGIQLYLGSEVGKNDMKVVRVYRPEAEVFSKDALSSLAHSPITNDHPPVPVTSDNWKTYSVGQSDGEVARDGQFVRVPMLVMDGRAIRDVEGGKAELSVGYSCDLKWEQGISPDGETYDAIQTNIRANHIAIVDAARGGPKLRIGDGLTIDASQVQAAHEAVKKGKVNKSDDLVNADGFLAVAGEGGTKEYPFSKDGTVYLRGLKAASKLAAEKGDSIMQVAVDSIVSLISNQGELNMDTSNLKTTIVDGISVQMTDVAVAIVNKTIANYDAKVVELQKNLSDAATATATQAAKDAKTIEDLQKQIATDAAKITTLETQVKDSTITPAKLDQMVKDRALVAGKAKAVHAEVVIDGKTETEIKSQVVTAKLGDKAKDWNEVQISAAFDTLTSGVEVNAVNSASTHTTNNGDGLDALRRAFVSNGTNDAAAKSQDAYDKRVSEAWKTPVKV